MERDGRCIRIKTFKKAKESGNLVPTRSVKVWVSHILGTRITQRGVIRLQSYYHNVSMLYIDTTLHGLSLILGTNKNLVGVLLLVDSVETHMSHKRALKMMSASLWKTKERVRQIWDSRQKPQKGISALEVSGKREKVGQ